MADLSSIVMDEIALEGLDGITIEGLFVRLQERPECSSSLNEPYKNYIWNLISNFNEIDIFELPEPRRPLVIFNRYDYVDPELGIVLEPDILPEEIYPHAPVDDKIKGIRGSCIFYDTRVSVYESACQLSLQDALDRWGSKLVIVASQKMRNLTLMGPSVDPELELTILQYCILERIGRSRQLGEVTQGRVSLQITGEDPKALFYHRKFLTKHGLIVKQIHHQKSGSQNCCGSLLHLPRFYVERWPKVLFLTKRVIEILRECKNYIADYEEIRKKLGINNALKKLFQTVYFQRFVRTDLRLPYRHLYPDAKENEWKSLNGMKEKTIRVVQLIDPNADIELMTSKDDEFDMDDDDHTEAAITRSEFRPVLNRSFLSQVYHFLETGGVNGYSQMELVQKMGLTKLSARTVTRNLLKKGVASTFMNDVGRQRVTRFRARKWDQQCTQIQNIERDLQNIRVELLNKAFGAGHDVSNISVAQQKNQKPKKRAADISVENLESELESTIQELHGIKRPSNSTDHGPPEKICKIVGLKNAENSPMENDPDSSTNLVSSCSQLNSESEDALRKYYQQQIKNGLVMTYRIFKRINLILEYIKIHRVVDDYSKFLKIINQEEEKEGSSMKIDKKSLLRLLIRLKEDGRVKLHSYTLTDGIKVKKMIFICDANVPIDHPSIASAIEQAKMKLFIVNRGSINVAAGANLNMKGVQTQKPANKKQKMALLCDEKMGRKYGFCPKFIRMRILHQFLFYLVYSYEGDINQDQSKVIPFLESKDIVVDESLLSELTHVHVLDVHWKMFIPPLPEISGLPKGWSIMCDILLRLPLSLFVRIFNVRYLIHGLSEYLQHPVRRHFLVSQLPVPMRNGLMAFRKYIFSIHEVLQRLCYIGLIQFGPQRLKEKDQVMIYLNRRTTLLNTIPSKPGYHQTSDEEYQEIKYKFNTLQDVDTYWYNLWNICINTQLGKDIVLEHLPFKPQMQEALQPVRPSRAAARDNGAVPGDRRGAAGLDSAIFAHLKRNWNWANVSASVGEAAPKKIDRRKMRLMNIKSPQVVFTKSAIIVKRSINYLHKGRFSALRSDRKTQAPPPDAEVVTKRVQKKQTIRRIQAYKKVNKPTYDDIDLKALQLMSKLRVEWSSEEDSLLLLCKVATMYLSSNPRVQAIPLTIIRDILHSSIPEARNKTARACQRRIVYMLKNLTTSNNLALHLEELKQDDDICERFGRTKDYVRKHHESVQEFEKRKQEAFCLLVAELQSRSNRIDTTSGPYYNTIPDKLDDFWDLFDVVEPNTVIKKKGSFQDVKNIVDIHCSVVNAIIHSSLCSTTDKTSWAYQLFRVYHQYPDSLLRAAMAKLRQDQMVSLKKSYTRHKQKANYLPLSASPYQLSVSYVQLIRTKYQYGVFHEAYSMAKDFLNWLKRPDKKQGMPTINCNGGGAAAIVELLCKERIKLSVEIPDQIIILDPWISEKDETYSRILQRYKDILQNCRPGYELTTSALFRPNVSNGTERGLTSQNTKSESMGEINVGEKPLFSKVHDSDMENNLSVKSVDSDSCEKTLENSLNIVSQPKNSAYSLTDNVSLQNKNLIGNSNVSELPCVSKPKDVYQEKHQQLCERNTSRVDSPLEELANSTANIKPVNMDDLSSIEECASCVNNSEKLGTNLGLKAANSQNISNLLDSNEQEISQDAASELSEVEHLSEKESSGDNENSKVEKNTNKKWGRLDFEWTSDKEWDVDSEINEKSGEEPDDADLPDDKRIRGDDPNTEGDPEDGDGMSLPNPQTLVARAATRIALFMMKDEMEESRQVKNVQHAHDFFVVNSCSVFAHLNDKQDTSEDCTTIELEKKTENKILGLKKEEVDEILNAIKSKAVVDIKLPEEEEVFNDVPLDLLPLVKCVVEFVESKKHLGVSLLQLRTLHENCTDKKLSLSKILSLLVEKRILLRTGVTTPRFVHLKHSWPWLAHTFKFVRLEREKIAPSGLRIVSCTEENNIMDVDSESFEEKALDNNSAGEKGSKGEVSTEEKSGTSRNELPKFSKQESNCTELSSLEKEDILNEDCELQKEMEMEPENPNNASSNVHGREDDVHSKEDDVHDKGDVHDKEDDVHDKDDDVHDKEDDVHVKDDDVRDKEDDVHDKEDDVHDKAETRGRRGLAHKSKQLVTHHQLGTIVGSKDMRKVAHNLPASEKDEIHICIRPWIRINGTLNRRILDRLLGSILGHAMYHPGQTLHTLGDRFQPALQPVHTRELVEILQRLRCVKMLVRKHRKKLTLFSKPEPVTLVHADGTEDEKEIIVEPEADAILRLGEFIGEKSYNQDFMAVQEDEVSDQRPADTHKKKRDTVNL